MPDGWQDYEPRQDDGWQDTNAKPVAAAVSKPANDQSTLKDIGTGIAEGTANTTGNLVSSTAHLLNKIPVVGEYLSPKEGIKALEDRTQQASAPHNTTQAIARTGEQIGEWLLPSGAEEKGAALLGKYLPMAGKALPWATKLATSAVESGLRNKSQGGEFGTGAEAGVGGELLNQGLQKAAPVLAESALGITKKMRGYGKTPGIAALEDTSGILPSTVERSAQSKIGDLTSDVEGMARSHPGTVSMRPAIATIDSKIADAAAENNGEAVKQLQKVRSAITEKFDTGVPLPLDQPASDALNLKRGVRTQFVKNWNPETMEGTRAAAAGAGHEIDNVLDHALGKDFETKNQRISSLIPVAERAESIQRGAPLTQRIAGRVAAHTGALTGAGIGYHEYGLPGAIAGLAIPEILSSPAGQMAAARAMKSGIIPKATRGIALQLDRDKEK